jgi:hypothetical protein
MPAGDAMKLLPFEQVECASPVREVTQRRGVGSQTAGCAAGFRTPMGSKAVRVPQFETIWRANAATSQLPRGKDFLMLRQIRRS